ncbi:helix-turn-helix transcriptional regulator [Verrucosispora sioxanthis]|nr:helix-turn-helix transcriptional regulator [Verrucosispora sioxanthis]
MAEADRLQSPTMVVLYPWLEQARAATLAAGGEPATAVKRLHDLVDRLRADGFAGHEALVLHDLVRLGQAAAQTGPRCSDGGRRTVAQRLTELSEQVDGELPPLLARHARASADGLPEGLLGAADGFAERGLDLLAAEAVAEAVHLLRQRRSPEVGHARQRLGALLAGCDMVHTPALQAATPTLTDREWQVARLAAVGGTSRAIAEQLFLSARTVENHLQRVYTKLGVTSRAELRLALGTIPGHDGTTAV